MGMGVGIGAVNDSGGRSDALRDREGQGGKRRGAYKYSVNLYTGLVSHSIVHTRCI